jgi:hypothetical protein
MRVVKTYVIANNNKHSYYRVICLRNDSYKLQRYSKKKCNYVKFCTLKEKNDTAAQKEAVDILVYI